TVLKRPVTNDREDSGSVAWSPTGKLLMAVSDDQHIYIASAGAGRAHRLPGTWQLPIYPEWTPDGKSLLVNSADGHLVQISVPGGARKILCHFCSSSPDRRSIAYVDSKNSLWVENADLSGKRRPTSDVHGSGWSPDGRSILVYLAGVGKDNSTLALVGVATGELRRLTDGKHSDQPLGFSADSRFIAFERGDSADD